jgi:hypothetical protein
MRFINHNAIGQRVSKEWPRLLPRSSEMSRRDFVSRGILGLGAAAALPAGALFQWSAVDHEAPVRPRAEIQGSTLRLGNEVIAAEWRLSSGGLEFVRVQDRRAGRSVAGPRPAFWLGLQQHASVTSAQMRLVGAPSVEKLQGDTKASRFSERLDGQQIGAQFRDTEGKFEATWRAVLRDGSHYVRQEVTFKALSADLAAQEVCLIDLPLENANVAGTVRGSPIVQGSWFLGFEHPLSLSAVGGGRARVTLARQLPLKQGQEVTYSSVIGVTAPGQFRRDFLQYVERERAHPYRTFLHYNSWYDFSPFTEAQVLDAINAIGQELHVKRGVTLDSFMLDDGWDDHKIWGFNSGFPRGFRPVQEATARYDSAPGVWLSPWGGYDDARKERLAYAKQEGFETNSQGLALSGPVYYKRFHEVCLDMIRDFGVNQFKIDGTGSTAQTIPGSQFGSDFEAAIALISDMRAAKPDLYVNLTTSTYPSPFWLRYADSTWRGGEDNDFAGVGTPRQQWITYRDAATFENIVERGPLYPLNSLMLHGLIFARLADKLDTDPANDFPSEVRSYFGSGTQCQEMYLTPSLLSARNWDALAGGAKWSRQNADVLVDTHWVGGDPNLLEVYGWASWSPRKAILTLRNPSDRPQTFEMDPQVVFELPPGAPQSYRVANPWDANAGLGAVELRVGGAKALRLEPFEVLTLEGSADI